MKLTRENIYINLQGKSKAELTELYWLFKNNNEDILNNNIDYFIEYYLNTGLVSYNFHFCCESWSCATLQSTENKTEVTIQQLKEILQPMENKEEQLIKEARERGFLTEGNEFYSCFDDKNKLRIIKPYDSESEINLYLEEGEGGCLRYYDGLNNKYDERLCSNPAIYKDGVWAEIKNNNLTLTLTEQLEKAEVEVKRLKEAIEDSKIKVGDFVKYNNTLFKVKKGLYDLHILNDSNDFKRITDQELINKLNELIK